MKIELTYKFNYANSSQFDFRIHSTNNNNENSNTVENIYE